MRKSKWLNPGTFGRQVRVYFISIYKMQLSRIYPTSKSQWFSDSFPCNFSRYRCGTFAKSWNEVENQPGRRKNNICSSPVHIIENRVSGGPLRCNFGARSLATREVKFRQSSVSTYEAFFLRMKEYFDRLVNEVTNKDKYDFRQRVEIRNLDYSMFTKRISVSQTIGMN